jgi:hypothetical protein
VVAAAVGGCKQDEPRGRAVIALHAIDGRIGPAHPAPAGAATGDLAAALAEVLGPGPGVPGRLFDGLTLGEPMPPAVRARIAAFERAHRARVRYDVDAAHAGAALTVRLPGAAGLDRAIYRRWGPPTEAWGSWADPAGHRRAKLSRDPGEPAVVWTPMRTIDELVAPGDPGPLGFTPVPVGTPLPDLQHALGARLGRVDDHHWEWWSPGFTAGFAVDAAVAGGIVVGFEADLPVTTPAHAAEVMAALRRKYGRGHARGDDVTWRRGRLTITARTLGGTVHLTIDLVR